MSRKIQKLVIALSIVGVIGISMLGALSVLPHAHGGDLNHSQHETCPIHQIGALSVDVHSVTGPLLVLWLLLCFFAITQEKISFQPITAHQYLRAPPTALLLSTT